jgi:hypothetical protein
MNQLGSDMQHKESLPTQPKDVDSDLKFMTYAVAVNFIVLTLLQLIIHHYADTLKTSVNLSAPPLEYYPTLLFAITAMASCVFSLMSYLIWLRENRNA